MGAKALLVEGLLILVHCSKVPPQQLFIFGCLLRIGERTILKC